MTSGPKKLTIDDCLDIIPLSYFQYRLLILCGVLFMADAMEVILLSFLTACAGETFHLNDAEMSSITSVVFLGQLIGTCFWGPFADLYGRRAGYLCACAMTSVFGILSGLSPNYPCLLTFRSLVGFGIAGLTVPFDLLAEFLPAAKRGAFLLYIEYFWTMGSILVVVLAWNLLEQYGWRLLAMLNAVPFAMGGLVGYFYLDESPRWLQIIGRTEEASDVLRGAAKMNGANLGDFELLTTEEELEEAEHQRSMPLLMHYAQLFADGVRGTTLPILTVWVFASSAYYGVVLFAGRIYNNNFGDAGAKACSFDYASIFETSAAEFIGIILAIFLITPVGRVRCQVAAYGISAVAVLVMGVLGAAGPAYRGTVLGFGMAARCASMAGVCCTWVHTPELFPTGVRATAHSLCNMGAKISGIFVSFLVFSEASNMDVAIVLSFFFCGAGLCATVLPETSGKTLDGMSMASSGVEEKVFSASMEERVEGDALELLPLGIESSSSPRVGKVQSYQRVADDDV